MVSTHLIAKSLTDNGINFEQLGGVQSNPLLSKVYEGIQLAKAKDLKLYWLLVVALYWIHQKPLLQELHTKVMFGISLLIKAIARPSIKDFRYYDACCYR